MSEALAYATALERADAEDPALAEQYRIAVACAGEAPSLEQLFACCDRGTHEGVLESALHLSVTDYERLEVRVKQVAKAAKQAHAKAWRSRRRRS